MMQLAEDWRAVLRHAWSVRWMAVAFACGFFEMLTTVFEPPQSFALRVLFALLGAASSAAGLYARLMAQKEFPAASAPQYEGHVQ